METCDTCHPWATIRNGQSIAYHLLLHWPFVRAIWIVVFVFFGDIEVDGLRFES